MKNKVLKLAKRMGKFTIDEITPILIVDKNDIMPVITELLEEKSLILNKNSIYFYNEVKAIQPNYPVFFEYRTPEEIDLIIKCFSLGLDSRKATVIIGMRRDPIIKFNAYFRKVLYEQQYQELIKHFEKKPYKPRVRNLFGITVYFYYYNNKTYVSNKKLISKMNEYDLPKSEDRKFRMDYLKLTRRKFHNTMHNYITHYIAEFLIRIHTKDEDVPIQLLTELISMNPLLINQKASIGRREAFSRSNII